jgi:hypothetical protein
VVAFCAGLTVGLALLFYWTFASVTTDFERLLSTLAALTFGVSLYTFSDLFSKETEGDRRTIREFFKKLDTPVDVAKEVFGAGKKQISTFPLVGGTTIVMGLMMSLILLTDIDAGDRAILAVMVSIMVVFGILMWYFGKKSEIRSAAQYEVSDHRGEAGS